MKRFVMIWVLVLSSAVLLSGCHSGGGGGAFWSAAKVSVRVSGLTGTVVLVNNNTDELSISSSGNAVVVGAPWKSSGQGGVYIYK